MNFGNLNMNLIGVGSQIMLQSRIDNLSKDTSSITVCHVEMHHELILARCLTDELISSMAI